MAQELQPPETLLMGDHIGAVVFQAAGGFLLAQAPFAGIHPPNHVLAIASRHFRQQWRDLDRLRRPPQCGYDVFRQSEDRQ